MQTNSVFHSGMQGLQSNLNGMQKSAAKIAATGTEVGSVAPDRVAESLVEVKVYEMGAKASTKLIKTADEMLGTLLDTFA